MTYQKHSYLLNGGDHRGKKVREDRCTAFTYIQSQGEKGLSLSYVIKSIS